MQARIEAVMRRFVAINGTAGMFVGTLIGFGVYMTTATATGFEGFPFSVRLSLGLVATQPSLETTAAEAMTRMLPFGGAAYNATLVLSRPQIAPMQGLVIAVRDHLQILNAVVRLVAVDVVNMLISVKWATEVLLHHPSVFKYAFTFHANHDVSVGVGFAPALPVVRI